MRSIIDGLFLLDLRFNLCDILDLIWYNNFLNDVCIRFNFVLNAFDSSIEGIKMFEILVFFYKHRSIIDSLILLELQFNLYDIFNFDLFSDSNDIFISYILIDREFQNLIAF